MPLTWTNRPENSVDGGGGGTFFFLIDDTHFFLIDDTYKLIIEDGSVIGPTIWTNRTEL